MAVTPAEAYFGPSAPKTKATKPRTASSGWENRVAQAQATVAPPTPQAPSTYTPPPSAIPPPPPSSVPDPLAQEQQRQEDLAAKEVARKQQIEEMRAAVEATPLDPNLIAALEARKRQANRAAQEAEVVGQRGRTNARLDFEDFMQMLGQQVDQSQFGLRQEAAARNLAFQPAFVGVGMRDIRDQASEAQTRAQSQRSQILSEIDRQIQEAQRARDEEVAAIAADRARAQADHEKWIEDQIAAIGTA